MKNLTLLLLLFFVTANAQTDVQIATSHLEFLTKQPKYRNHKNPEHLDFIAAYIRAELKKYADTTYYQVYEVNGIKYRNVLGVFGEMLPPTIVIGAHYDVCGDQEGADDNASGIVGLLETARQLKGKKLKHRIELVAYTLEEPPYFRTEYMGSYVHAKSLHDTNRKVEGMIVLEMIGYFTDQKNSQQYPLGMLSWIYGSTGDYITLVSKFGKGKFARQFMRAFKDTKTIKTEKFSGPAALQGIDYSDHLNYWKFGYSALMITDTSFFRNANYHEKTDQMGTLDVNRMCKVVDGVVGAVLKVNE